MSDDLIKRLRHISRLDAENYGALPEDAAEWKAADTIEALRAENKALKQQVEQGKLDAVPEGWVAIPIIPTDKQIRAMEDQWMRGSNMDMAMREYRSAIAAAPKQEN